MALSLSMVLKHSAVVILTRQEEPAAKKKKTQNTAKPAAAYTNVTQYSTVGLFYSSTCIY